MNLFTVFVLSLFLTIALIPIIKRMDFRMNLMDFPDERKIHELPMSRSGGIAMALGGIIPVLIWVPMNPLIRSLHVGCALIVIFGVVDDVKSLKYTHKLLVQTTGALVVMFYGNVRIHFLGNLVPSDFVLPYFLSIALTLIFIVGVTNAINLSDGLDGLAGGISMLSFVSIAFLAYRCGNMDLAIMCLAVVGSILGFLRYNTYPAIVFMGDAGSQMLGFLCAVFTLILTQCNTPYSQITPLFLIGFPILDTLTVMVERIANGGSPFKSDKNHLHHKLMKLGLYHSESVLAIYFFQALFISCAIFLRFYSNGVNFMVFIGLAGTIILLFELSRKKQFHLRVENESLLGSTSVLALIGGERFSIRFFFTTLKWGLHLLFFFQCIICESMPRYLGVGAACFIALILITKRVIPKARKNVLRVVLYCSIPLLMYFSTIDAYHWMGPRMVFINNSFFIILIFFVIATLNLTKRSDGFKINPLDFLIFIIIIIFPNLPSIHLEDMQIKMVVAKILILFFSFDVLLGELRQEDTFLEMSLLATFSVIILKSFI